MCTRNPVNRLAVSGLPWLSTNLEQFLNSLFAAICLADRGSSIFGPTANRRFLGGWAAPGGRDTFQKGGGLRRPSFWKVSRPPGAAQTPKIYDLRSAKKSYIKNPGVKSPRVRAIRGQGLPRLSANLRQFFSSFRAAALGHGEGDQAG